jgi:hypothetical protein
MINELSDKLTKLRGFGPRDNSTDRPSYRRLLAKLVPNFADRCRVVSTTDSTVVNLSFLDRSRYFSFK